MSDQQGAARATVRATFATPHRLDAAELDGYAQRGVALSRDAASVVAAALRRDAYDLRTRPCEANNAAADVQDALASAIVQALNA
jgi:hypothetical protein